MSISSYSRSYREAHFSAFHYAPRKEPKMQSNPATPPKKTATRFVLFKLRTSSNYSQKWNKYSRSQIQIKFQNKFKKYSADKRLCYSAVPLWFSTKPDAPEKYLCHACRQTSMIGGIFPFKGIFDKTSGVWSIMVNYPVLHELKRQEGVGIKQIANNSLLKTEALS